MSFRFWNTNFIFGSRRDDDISGSHRKDFIFAGRGDDIIHASAGRDTIYGGRGFDNVVYRGSIDDYAITLNAGFFGRTTRVESLDGSTGKDTLRQVEALTFDDFTLFLDGRNNGVLAADDNVATGENGLLTVDAAELLANDRDFDGDNLTISAVSPTSDSGATVSLVDGQVIYDPGTAFDALAEGEVASDTFTYTVSDGRGGDTTATVTVTITGSNDAPVLTVPRNVAFAENGDGIVVQAAATDAEGDTVSYTLTGADAAFFSVSDTGALSFLTAPDFEAFADADGDNAYEVTVVADDGSGGSDASDVTVTVTDVDETPAPDFHTRINEVHYDNVGADTGEFVEIRADAGADVTGLRVDLYNGSNGQTYASVDVADLTKTTDGTNDYYVWPRAGIQNGSPDGIALSYFGRPLDFVSYEGTLVATDGPMNGLESNDMGVFEVSDTAAGLSLQRDPEGNWFGPVAETPGAENDMDGGGGGGGVPNARVNEVHYDNAGGDEGEFVEIRTDAGDDVSALTIELLNGSNGTVYASTAVAGLTMTSDGTYDYYVWPREGIQNGAPDGVALANDGTLIEFLSYEGTFEATAGAALGVTSTDIGVSETSTTPIGQSLQRNDDGSWNAPAAETPGAANDDDDTGGGGGEAVPRLISEVQGSGAESALVGQRVTLTAIVVGDFQNDDGDALRDLGGFFLQQETGDGDAATSEGIFIFDPDTLADVSVGDRVEVTGTVAEFFGATQVRAEAVSIVEAGAVADVNTLATQVSLDEVDATTDLESVEGMLVEFTDTLTVNELFQLDRFNEVGLSAAGRPEQYTQFNEPDVDGFATYQAEVASDRILLDDGLSVQNAPILPEADLNGDGTFDTSDGFNMGDTITGLTGVVDFSFGEYRVRTVDDGNAFEDTNTRDDTPPDVGGDLTVASFNVLNLFTTIDGSGMMSGPNNLSPRGADSEAEYERQLDKLVTTIIELDADIVGLVELENEFGGDQNGDGRFAIDALTTEINARIGSEGYTFVDPGRAFVDTGDAISVGMIYKATSVTLGDVEILDDSDLDALGFGALDDDGTGVFDGPGTNRAPLAATFTDNETGEDFTVAVTHMKSKGGSGEGGNADLGDGAGNFDELRTEGVEVLTAWLDDIGDKDGVDDAEAGDVLVLGDFNAYAREDPIDAMLAEGYTNLEEQFDASTSTFVFDGFTGTLDYAFANGGLADNVTGAGAWSINSAEADALDYNLDFGRDPTIFDGSVPWRASDHDPLLVGLDFTPDDIVVG